MDGDSINGLVERIKMIDTIDREQCRKHVENNFSVEKMVDGYEEIYKKLYRLFKLVKSNKDKHELKLNFNEIYNQLVSVILHDPHLPKDFLPNDWQYAKTVELAKKLRSIFLNQN